MPDPTTTQRPAEPCVTCGTLTRRGRWCSLACFREEDGDERDPKDHDDPDEE